MPTPKFTPAEKARAEAVADILTGWAARYSGVALTPEAYGLPADVLPAAPVSGVQTPNASHSIPDEDRDAWALDIDPARMERSFAEAAGAEMRPFDATYGLDLTVHYWTLRERARTVLTPTADTCEAR